MDAIALNAQLSQHRGQVFRMAVMSNPSEFRMNPYLGRILRDRVRISFEIRGLVILAGKLTHLVSHCQDAADFKILLLSNLAPQ